MSHRCEQCQAVVGGTKVLRCTKCKACFYCSKACQKRNWKLHKRVCTTDPSLRPFVPVEMAIERALKRQPMMEEAPKDAFCYICLEGDDGGKLMRGCACRGASAGFAHVECLTKLAVSQEEADAHAVTGWETCGNCKQSFTGALGVEIIRRFWRRHRSSPILGLRYYAATTMATCLGGNAEIDVANRLNDAAPKYAGTNKHVALQFKLNNALLLSRNGRKLEALELLDTALPDAIAVDGELYFQLMMFKADVYDDLDRYQEFHDAPTEAVAIAKATFGPEHDGTLVSRKMYATSCAKLDRMEEAKAILMDVLAIETQLLGRDHPQTQQTRTVMERDGLLAP